MDDARQSSSRRSRSPRARRSSHRRSHSPRDGRSSHTRRHGRHRHRAAEGPPETTGPVTLPLNASELHKSDDSRYWSLFARYLDLQKNLDLSQLDRDEAWGRWKSFVKRWNRGQLAEGWYDPQQLETAAQAPREPTPPPRPKREAPRPQPVNDTSSDSEDLGPALPTRQSAVSGPAIPSFGDLRLKRENEAEDREDRRSQLRQERRAERALEQARLDELAPKAEAGTRERQLQKRREAAASNRAFAAAKDGGDAPEVADGELLGEGEDSLQSFRREKQEQERRKTEKQLRRDEIARARRAEHEERVREFQQREERTMEGLLKLAKERYG